MKFSAAFAAVLVSLLADVSAAETFFLGASLNGITGESNATLTEGALQLKMSARPSGSVFQELSVDGMGLDSSGVSGVVDESTSRFNILGGSAAGQGESVEFSFDTAGVLDGIRFDGLKDETLEHFTLELPDGTVLTLFDFEVELRLNQQNFQLSDLGVPSPAQADGPSDDFSGLAIPFAAGQVFTLTYGEIDYDGAVLPGYIPSDDNGNPTGDLPNGARFQGVVVNVVPEPSSWLLVSWFVATLGLTKRISKLKIVTRASVHGGTDFRRRGIGNPVVPEDSVTSTLHDLGHLLVTNDGSNLKA